MKKLMGTSLVVATLASTLVTGGLNVFAAQADSHDSDVTAKIIEGGGVDPNDPDTQPPILIDPVDPGDVLQPAGSLGLAYASHFDFGTIKLNGSAIDVNPTNQVEDPNNASATIDAGYGVEIRDVRGKGDGWKVNVSLSEFKDASSSNTLNGVELVLPAGDVKTTDANTPTQNQPTANTVTLAADSQPNELFTAQKDQGMGIWADTWTKDDIHLKAPANQYAGEYKATITYDLLDTPA